MIHLIGQAIHHYHNDGDDTPITTYIDGEKDEEMSPKLFFRSFIQMNYLERAALKLCKGEVLDIGAAAGCHSLILQKRGLSVTALEISEAACEVMKQRGVKTVINEDLLAHQGKYDTILLLMNGFGLAQRKALLPAFVNHLKDMLRPGGQIIGDSTDITYHFEKSEQKDKAYYGEVDFKLSYKKQEEHFPWLYADENLLKEAAFDAQLNFEVIERNNRNAFLVRMCKST